MNDRERIGKCIAEKRKLKGILQVQLSQLTGIDAGHIAQIEQGRFNVGFDTLARLCEPLGLKIELVEKKD